MAKRKNNATKTATKQAVGVSPLTGTAPPKEKQFGKPNGNPRHNGAWKKEDTARYKLEQIMKLSADELQKVAESPQSEAEAIMAEMLLNIKKHATSRKSYDLERATTVLSNLINQAYGTPKQQIEQTTYNSPKPLLDRTIDEQPSDNDDAKKDKTA